MNHRRTVTYAVSYLFTLCFIATSFLVAIPTAVAAGTCMATPDDGTTVFSSADSQAVRDAITAATAGDTIKIAGDCVGVSGTELADLASQDLTLQGGYDGTNWNVAPDPATYPTTLDADANGRVFDISASTITLDGLILTNGDAGAQDGGAINVDSSSIVTLTNSTVCESSATNGGGIYNGGVLSVSNTDILSNTASEDAGGIYNGNSATLTMLSSIVSSNTATIDSVGYAGGIYGRSTVVISDTIFHNNHASWRGGALYTLSNSPQLTNVTFTDNSANRGGAYNPRGSDVTINDALFSGNSAVKGGGLYADFGEPTLTNVTFYNNTASGEGGGLYAIESANVTTIQQSTFYSNTATNGGAIYNINGSEVLATNVTISGNHADEAGGGAYTEAFFDLQHVTMVSNTAVITGDGLYANTGADVALLSDNIIAYHQDDNCAIGGTGAIFSLGYNLEDADDCGLSNTADITNADPLLSPLADNGGNTLTHALLITSPALNSGSSSGIAIDQRGVTRPQYGVADRGAYELDSFSCATNSNVSDELGLQTAIFCYNAATSGSYAITLTDNITLTSATPAIANTSGATLAILGDGYTLDGNNSERHFTIEGGLIAVDSLTFANGYTADDGGSLWLGDDATVSLNGTDFAGNTAVGSGGAIYATGTFTIENSTLSGNTAYSGGAIYGSGNTAVVNSTFTGNTAVSDDGGAIYADDGVTTLENSTLSGNTAADEGGGINSINTLTITHTTIVSNTAGGLGDNLVVKSPSNVTVGQSIIAYSADADDNCAFFGASLTDAGDNVVSDSSCDMSNPDSLEDTDPLLEPLADNGGQTATHAIGLDSPALNFVITTTLTTDQRGVGRPQGGFSDAGAYEYAASCPSFPVSVASATALNEAIFCFNNEPSGTHTINFTADITLDQWLLYVENPNASLVIAGDGYTLSGDNLYPLFGFGEVAVDINDLTLTEGNADLDIGGAIFFGNGAIATLDNTHAISNTAEDGGAYFMMPTAVVTLTNSTLISNTATLGGGAIYNRGVTYLANITGTLNYADDDGGVIYNTNVLTITDSLIQENASGDDGGGLYNSDDDMYIFNTRVLSNTAVENGGGAANRDFMVVVSSTIAYNSAGQFGGGLRSSSDSFIVVEDSLIRQNFATEDGGGIEINGQGGIVNTQILTNTSDTQGGGVWVGEYTEIDDSLIQGNIAPEGGGIYNGDTLIMAGSTISDNEATDAGGGLFNCDCGSVAIENTLFANNQAGSGGGGAIYNDGFSEMLNNTLSGNSATGSLGGGVYNDSEGLLEGYYLTLSGNSATLGGGVVNAGLFFLEDSIVTNSTGNDCFSLGGIEGGNNNLIDEMNCTDLDRVAAVTNFDTTLADNGGDTLTHALLTGSNAIDTAVGFSPDSDQRGVERPQISTADIGAYEYAPDCTTATNSVSNALELNVAIACYNEEPSGSHTITFTQNITATADVTHIDNLTATLTLRGQGYTLDGANQHTLLTIASGVVYAEAITLTNAQVDMAQIGPSLHIKASATVTMRNSVIQYGHAIGGAALYNDGGQVALNDTTVQYNESDGGGTIENNNSGQLSISGGLIYSNTGVFSGISNQSGTLSVDGTRIEAQYDSQAGAAAINNLDIAMLNNVTVISNTLGNNPGTITNIGIMTVTNSVIADNVASGSGGGFDNQGSLTISQTTISNNGTSGAGGGISSSGALTLTHVTLYGNSAFTNTGDSLALSNGSTTVMDYTLIDGSTDVACFVDGAATFTGAENLVDDTSCGEASIGRVGAPTNVDATLADNGGDTLTHALLVGSNAIDAAVSSTAVIDQRGITRPQDTAPDIGAFEYATDASLTITVALQGRTGYTGTYTVDFYEMGNVTTPTLTLTETALADGVLTLTGIPADTYTVTIRTLGYLQAAESIVLTAGNTAVLDFGTLLAGDANGDKAVNILDLSILAGAYNTSVGDAGYDERADFNGDGSVNILDLSLLAGNYNTAGESP